jgi:hypothetical protein
MAAISVPKTLETAIADILTSDRRCVKYAITLTNLFVSAIADMSRRPTALCLAALTETSLVGTGVSLSHLPADV